jgi:cbb3-type cytochrome oxidase subunit 3
MKFINYLERITNISIFPLISLLLFFTFFVLVAIYVYRTPKKIMQQRGQLPLEQ